MAELPKMKYRVVTARNLRTEETLLRPLVTARNSMTMKQLVGYAKTAGYVRGQQKDLEGLLGGFIEAMQDRGKAGYSININDWFIISGHLKGTVGEDRQLTDANTYHVTITATKDLQVGIENFSWTNVDDTSEMVKFKSITSPGGIDGEIQKTKAIHISCLHGRFDATKGDNVKITYAGLETPISVTPSEKSETYLRFDWATALAEVEVGTVLTFTGTFYDKLGGTAQSTSIQAILRSAS